MKKQSLWIDTAASPEFPRLKGRVEVDVAIVGGGITGLTTAYLLKKEGCRVAVVDQQNIGGGETGHTTAHLTFVTDARLSELVSRVGREKAQALWDAGAAAMVRIEEIADELKVNCELRHVPGYLFAAAGKDAEKESASLKDDAALAGEFGYDAVFLPNCPVFERQAIRFPNQLKFHPLKYLNALATAIPGNGCHIFANTSGSDIDSDKHEIRTDEGVLAYHSLVSATHVPIQGERGTVGAALFQTKLAAYSTYAMEAEIDHVPEALYWDTNDPYLYVRFDRIGEKCSVIIGGEDHKTGQEKFPETRYERLLATLKGLFPEARPVHRWSGQVLETPDGLPYIGEVGTHQFLGTGYAGNGITLGTFAAMQICDRVCGKQNAWGDLFSPDRKAFAGVWEYLKENKDYPAYFIKEHLSPPASPNEIRQCQGAIVKIDGKKRAVYIDEEGKRTVLSPVCPHMGCIVAWNAAEKTWDCPCHGSRFMSTGEVLSGPAETNLESADAE